ncbi:hypothetical protein [Haloferax sulfurifontis]|uniref:hypothetical protein n=1 Tax=Haloferax sulfurifontis TaxID=255616 RepID=UPI001267B3D5|nr:hypothetical protein [Haloferax sulfurifontis]
MSVQAIRDVANIQYGGFYIPVAGWFYIYQQNPTQLAFFSIGAVLLGATLVHSVLYSVFGPEGPQVHPKKDLTVIGYSLALLYTKNPGSNPDTIDEFGERLSSALSIRRTIRFVVLLCIGAAYVILALYSFAPLYQLTVAGDSLIPGILLLTQTIFILQGVMMNRFANVLPPNEAEWVWVPEYRRVNEVFSEDKYPNNPYRDPPLIFNDIKSQLAELQPQFASAQLRDGEGPE